jgi:hypothetical protein
MAIRFQCPKCLSMLKVADDQAGKIGPCPACQGIVKAPDLQKPIPVPVLVPLPIVTFRSGEIHFNITTKAQAKSALQEIRLKKREILLEKKESMELQRQVRASYTDYVRKRGSQFRGGGQIGRFIRTLGTLSRDQQRRALANELAPYERSRREIEARILMCDNAIHEIQIMILKI